MGNSLKSMNSRKSQYDKDTNYTFKDRVHLEVVDAEPGEHLLPKPKKELGKMGYPRRAKPGYYRPPYEYGYCYEKRSPLWVLDKIEPSDFKGTEPVLQTNNYRFDPSMKPFFTDEPDYEHDWPYGGFKVSQLASSTHHPWNWVAIRNCFVYSNAIPISLAVEKNIVIPLQNYIADIGKKHQVWIYSGPIWQHKTGINKRGLPPMEDGFRVMKYLIINNKIAYPTAFFKVIIAEINEIPHLGCLVGQNGFALECKEVTLSTVEEMTGLTFPGLNKIRTAHLFTEKPYNAQKLMDEALDKEWDVKKLPEVYQKFYEKRKEEKQQQQQEELARLYQ